MAEDVVLRMPIDPRGLPPGTSGNNFYTQPTSGKTQYDVARSKKGIVSTGLALQVGRSIAGTAKGLVGDMVGSQSLQSDINTWATALGYATTIGSLGVGGAIIVGVDLGSQAVANVVKVKNKNNEARYNNTLYGNKILGNR